MRAPDVKKKSRDAIVFKLVPLSAFAEQLEELGPRDVDDLAELRKKALAAAKAPGGPRGGGSPRSYYERSRMVRDYVLARANGRCESCNGDSPFWRANGSPYLEPHHIRRVSDGGPDHPAWVGAVCPNCHREIHHGQRGTMKNKELRAKIERLETGI